MVLNLKNTEIINAMKNSIPKYLFILLPALFAGHFAGAQDAAGGQAAAQDPFFYDRFAMYFFIGLTAVIAIGAFIALFRLLNMMVQVQQIRLATEQNLKTSGEPAPQWLQPQESLWRRLYKRWTNVVPVEREGEIMFHHDFDGIHELDNKLPPWWVALFYITIAFAVVYMTYYHFTDMGASSTERYEAEVKAAQEAIKANLAKQANLVDENSVTETTDATALSIGKNIYNSNCVACHGANGEGGVGPNLTDKYWIHGGNIKDLFKTIKYGVPAKGMISWQSQLRPIDMQNVASYILTLQGTNPANAKEPQGTLYEPGQQAAPADSTAAAVPADTTATATGQQ